MLIAIHLIVYGAFALAFGAPSGLEAAFFAVMLIWASVIDTERFEIPDAASLILICGGLIRLTQMHGALFYEAVFGAVLWPLMFWGVAQLFLTYRNIDGLGFGDVKLMAGLGLWCGFTPTISVVLTASICAMLVLGLSQLVQSDTEQPLSKTAVAFGPFLCLSAWAVWLMGNAV